MTNSDTNQIFGKDENPRCMCGHLAKFHEVTNLKQIMMNQKILAKVKCKFCKCRCLDI